MEKTNHIPSGVFPFIEASGVRSNLEALDWERHEEMVEVHARRSITNQTLHDKCWVLSFGVIEANPLSKGVASEPAYKRWLYCPKILFISMVQSLASVGVRLNFFCVYLMNLKKKWCSHIIYAMNMLAV